MALLTSTITRSTIYPLLQYNSKPFLSSSLSPAKASLSLGRSSHITHARRGISSRTRRLEKGRKGAVVSPEEEQEEVVGDVGEGAAVEDPGAYVSADGVPMPELPGVETDFWEGPQWNAFGFFIQYLWAFGIIFGLIACGIAVATYNEGATDFKETSVYKESVQSQEFLEEQESSGSDVFEANPTEEAPNLE
ncbi:uncharacterized protein LOC120260605 [Dioscorea cayenensis subsp. rotundata]|uniref:Uncharacterized protein LOC120260605 n=1 Tax=Dioscorea cayennensis subsp. rotundata TaxID=55577 RepID=A0AB40BAR0_DIOCR|nr:uncharacterized protein LOC120260605 [Dioscorea cayenensis subsp. rotundata]